MNFSRGHPLLQIVFAKGKHETAQGPWTEFSPVIGGPGEAVLIETGSESWAGVRNQATKKGSFKTARIVYHWEVPNKDIEEAASDPQSRPGLIQNYGEAAIADVLNRIEQQYLIGGVLDSTGTLLADASNGFRGLGTFNGDKTGLPTAGLENGWLEFAAPASQSNTVHNLVKRGGSGGIFEWYNQFPADGNITNWDAHGYERVKNAHNSAADRAKGSKFCLISDQQSFEKFESSLTGAIRYVNMDGLEGEPGADWAVGLVYAPRGIWYGSTLLDDTQSTFAAARRGNGIGYIIPADHFRMKFMRGAAGPVASGSGPTFGLKVEGPIPIPLSDQSSYKLTVHAAAYADRLNAYGAVSGMTT
jgi:hypothetical protein